MTLAAGLGDVTTKNSPLLAANCSEAVVAIPVYDASNNPTGENWIIFHDHNSNTYRVYKTNLATISLVTSYSVGFAVPGQPALLLKTNGCFDKIAFAIYNSGRVEVVPFNNVTGVISAPSLILAGTGGAPFLNPEVFGIEFSPDERFLYVTESGLNLRKTIYQFNISLGTGLNPAAVLASKSFFTGDVTVVRFGHLQLGPDGKIYCPGYTNSPPSFMSVVATPNVAWTIPTPTAAEFQFKQYTYAVKRVGEGLPTFSQDFLRQIKIFYNNACEGGTTSFSYIFGGSAVSQTWDFGDPGSGALNTSTSPSPSHIYATAGTYTATLTILDNCGRTRVGTVNVIVKTGPVVSVVSGACPNTNILFTGTGTNNANYTWSNSSTGLPVIATGTTYTYNGALPKTMYVQDPTPLATYTVGNSTATSNFGADVGHTYFELYTTVKITSFQVTSRVTSGTANVSIQNAAGSVTYWGPNAVSPTASGQVFTRTPNVTLAPGLYRFSTSDVNILFRNNTTNDGGRDVPGVINVTGENNGIKGGSFINIIIELPDPCGIRAYTVIDDCILPVNLLNFKGVRNGNVSDLSWVTSSEQNSSHFIVQRSLDGINYSDIATVNAAGNSTSMNKYSATDYTPSTRSNYYRLLQYDMDGTVNISEVVVVNMGGANISVAPNPFSQDTKIQFSDNINANITVLDILGRVLLNINTEGNENDISIGSDLVPGSYLLRIVSEAGVNNFMIIKE